MHLQPSNFKTWQALGEYDLRIGQPQAALQALRAAVYLNPEAVAPRAEIADRRRTALDPERLPAGAARGGSSGGTAAH